MANLILVINPGSTSTKLAVFNNTEELFSTSISHDLSELEEFNNIIEQKDYRLEYILDFLSQKDINLQEFTAIVGRGGLLKPLPGGTYRVNERMISDLKEGRQGEHASNLGGILAQRIADRADCIAYIVDPVVVDEMTPVAKLSGHPEFERRSLWHALNQKAIGRKYAENAGKKYEELNLIIAHLGGGISVALHNRGKIVDVNNALSGEGPFSPNRTGGLPTLDLVEKCYSEEYSYREMKSMLVGQGGLMAYLGTNDAREVEKEISRGNQKAELIFSGMAYQVSKEIGSLAPVVAGNVDAVILTGGIAHSKTFTEKVKNMISYLAPVNIYPGEEEMYALAAGACRVIKGEEEAKNYN